MMTVTLTVQVKVDTADPDELEKFVDRIETPIEDEEGVLNHLEKYGYEIMIMDRKESKLIALSNG